MSDKYERDLFKEDFKYYKKRNPLPDFEKVIDFDRYFDFETVIDLKDTYNSDSNQCSTCKDLDLYCHKTWRLFSIKGFEGFFYIRNPFSVSGQQKWIQKCLEQYPCKPSITNLDAHYKNIDDIWSYRNEPDPEKCYLKKLCWATLGYHHNWDTKIYNKDHKSGFPPCLKELSKHLAETLGFTNYNPEAAIVNYYNTKSSLSIHNDHSEVSKEPIISFSFGQTGLFLIGTENKFDKPEAVFLRSGDVIVMSGKCRLSYHAVPCILEENVDDRYFVDRNSDWLEFYEYINKSRINISVRQVY